MRLVRPILSLVVVGVLAGPAAANGVNTHVWISLHAIEHLPEDSVLRELMERPESRLALINGSVFPDGGYVIEDEYGEMAHWEPFVDAYAGWIRDTQDLPLSRGSSAEHVVFLMGVASHGMADQTFDSMFMEAARVYDADGWSDELFGSLDTATDVLLVADTGQRIESESWAPADVLADIYRDRLGYDIDANVLLSGQDLLHRLVLTYGIETGLNDPGRVAEYRAQYPWSAANLLDGTVPGSPPCEGAVVAAYWRALWDRLHGDLSQDNVIIATAPSAGSAGHVTDHTAVEAQVVLVFGHGIDRATLQGAVSVTDTGGVAHDVDVVPWAGNFSNVVRLIPQQDWAQDTDYTVTIGAGVTAIDGLVLEDDWSFTFSTRDGDAATCSDPTPSTSEPDDRIPPASSGGCQSGGAPASAVVWLVLLAVFRGLGRSTWRMLGAG